MYSPFFSITRKKCSQNNLHIFAHVCSYFALSTQAGGLQQHLRRNTAAVRNPMRSAASPASILTLGNVRILFANSFYQSHDIAKFHPGLFKPVQKTFSLLQVQPFPTALQILRSNYKKWQSAQFLLIILKNPKLHFAAAHLNAFIQSFLHSREFL